MRFYELFTFGYPAPPPMKARYPTLVWSGDSGYTNGIQTGIFFHSLDTTGGQSGSPIFEVGGSADSVVGIHSGPTYINEAVRMQKSLAVWIEANGGF